MRLALPTLAAGLCALALLATPAPASAQASEPQTARVIVRLKADSALLGRVRAQSLGAADGGRAEALGRRIGHGLRGAAHLDERTQLVTARGMDARQLAQRLAAQPDVEYAVVDQRRRHSAVPDDPRYPGGQTTITPEVGQWYLRPPGPSAPAAIDAQGAWDFGNGSANVVVAVLDTGSRPDHPDLLPVGAGGNQLPGYDMIAEALVAGDGNGRDGDPSDTGDWLSRAEINANPAEFGDCPAQPLSSWHGLQVAGLIAARTGNGAGMASVGRNVRVLPVRVLGKCGGYDSDIVAAIRWAAGLDVPGVPRNRHPAQVINLSLGSEGQCEQIYRDAIADARAVGAVVVASAGNSAGHPVHTPANCPGVVAVGGLRHLGSKVGYSDMGPEITLSAPAGNCVNLGVNEPCLYPILTLTNAGATRPVRHVDGGSVYTDSFDATVGTSFAAPLVAGTAALMLSAQPSLTPDEVRSGLQRSARAFPTRLPGTGPQPPRCPAPAPNIDVEECLCTSSTCGAGMLDAAGAVAAVASVQARIGVAPAAPLPGGIVTLSAAPSLVASGRRIVAWRWTLVDRGGIVNELIGATSGGTVSAMPVGEGRFVVALAITDDQGTVSSTQRRVVVGLSSPPPPGPPTGGGGGGGGGALGAGWLALLALAAAFSSRPAWRKAGSPGRTRRC